MIREVFIQTKFALITMSCLVLSTMTVWPQQIAHRVIKYSNTWQKDSTIFVNIILSGAPGDFSVVEHTPQEWNITRILQSGTLTNGTISWNSTLSDQAETKQLTYIAKMPSFEPASYDLAGDLNGAPIQGDRTFDPSRINPGVQTPIFRDSPYNYLLYLPHSYNETKEEWPLIIFLHGSGESGPSINSAATWGPLKFVGEPYRFSELFGDDEIPFVIISPHLSVPNGFESAHLLDVLNHAKDDLKIRIDDARIYITGYSLGGMGTWSFASDHPEIPAAIAPVAGNGLTQDRLDEFKNPGLNATKPENLVDIPIWAFHGERDTAVPLHLHQETVDQVIAHGGNVKFTIFPNARHEESVLAYENPELYQWMLAQQKQTSSIDNWQLFE